MKKQLFTKVLQDGIRKVLRNPKYRFLAIIAGLVYFLSPIDIIPDAIPVLGWIDDGVIVSFLIAEVSQLMVDQIQARKKNNPTQTETVRVDNIPVNNVIDVDAVSVS